MPVWVSVWYVLAILAGIKMELISMFKIQVDF